MQSTATGDKQKVTVKFFKKHMDYVNLTSFFSSLCSIVAPKIHNFLKTKYTTDICSGHKERAVKILHTRAKHVK